MRTTVFLCRASGEGSHDFRICREEADVWQFYEEMFGAEPGDTKELSVKHFRDPDQWSNNGTAYRVALYNAEFEVWKVPPVQLLSPLPHSPELAAPAISPPKHCRAANAADWLGGQDKHVVLKLAYDELELNYLFLQMVAGATAERLNAAVTLLADAALSEDFDAEGLLGEIERIKGPLAQLGKTSDWLTVNQWYEKLCALCGVSDEDEINVFPLVEARLALLKPCAEQLAACMGAFERNDAINWSEVERVRGRVAALFPAEPSAAS